MPDHSLWGGVLNSPGRQIGRYELLEILGSGGMAEVYRARLSGPGRASKPVALKLIRPQLANDGQFVLMFLDELRIALALSHRNIVQTFDGGEADGHYFLVMELVQGPSLAGLLKELPPDTYLPPDLALFIAAEICAALDHAHGYVFDDPQQPTGVMHRDVSPGNILLSDQGDVKLTDFGVAKATGRIVVTMTDLVKGKLTYMSPEQARGTVTPVSDLYSLGAVLYEMLTRRPIRRTATLEEARIGHLQVPPLRKLRPELSPALEEVVMQCLSTDPALRPASARVLLQFLSEESRRIPLEEAHPLDPRMRLHAFLVRDEGQGIQPDRQDRAKRLAQAMISEAEDVPEDSFFRRGRTHTMPDEGEEEGGSEGGSSMISGADSTLPVAAFWEDSATDEQPSLVYEEQQDSEALPFTDLIAAEAPTEQIRKGRVALIAGAIGALLLVALVWLWQDSAPVEELASSTTPVPDDQAVTSQFQGTDSPPGDTGLLAGHGGDDGGNGAEEAPGGSDPVDSDVSTAAPSRRSPTSPARESATSRVNTRKGPSRPAVKPRRRGRRRSSPPPGPLNLNTDPWAKVYVDQKYRGETPLQGLRLSPGRHKIYLHNPKRALSARVTVQIRSGKTVVKVIKLAPQ